MKNLNNEMADVGIGTLVIIFLSLNQERGASINLELTAPNSFGNDRYVKLYP